MPLSAPIAVHPAFGTSALGEWARSGAATAAAEAYAAASAELAQGELATPPAGFFAPHSRMAPGLRTNPLLPLASDASHGDVGEAVPFGSSIMLGTEMSRLLLSEPQPPVVVRSGGERVTV